MAITDSEALSPSRAPDGADMAPASPHAGPREALKRACHIVGGQKLLARRIGTKQSRVWYCLEKSRFGGAAQFVLPIEAATGVPRHALHPDIYPAPVIAQSESEQEQHQEAGHGLDR